MAKDISRFLNSAGIVIVWPKKHSDKNLVLAYLITKFDMGVTYNENEVNEILKQWHTFNDWPLLRRSLVDGGLLTRDINGYRYERPQQ